VLPGIEIEINPADLQRLKRSLEELERPDLLEPELKLMGQDVMRITKKYPPALPRPAFGPWYERGWGWTYSGVRGPETSERLGDKWYSHAFPSYVEVGNRASYAGWVHGPDQRPVHKAHNWRKLEDVAWRAMPALINRAKEHIKRIWEAKT
jgi:hypothetical protein